ncbi:MAG TPA: ribonuclease H-like domain-containing protein, partial [Lacipirellulaceae bacterium]|nr:ribonuclease H-like domain-containing protein [Lacipirellulaceae bacterium]
DAGAHWLIELPLDDVWPGGEQLVARRAAALRQAAGDAAAASADPLAPFIRCLPEGAALLDLETCGLAGSALFLVQVAADHADPARLADVEALATFNGKSFDWPMVADRSRRHRLPAPPPAVHVDLLHASRRRWGASLPDCRLQTLERRICGRERPDDIPGSQIPAAYEQYVRTGFEREMDAILLHNAVDLVTMLDLSLRLAGPGE